MLLVADCHVHLYACYDLSLALQQAFENLAGLAHELDPAGAAVRLCLLTERADCHYFRKLSEISLTISGVSVERCAPNALVARRADAAEVYFIAGRQLRSAENLEVLALGADLEIGDGKPLTELISSIAAEGALAVINWAPGKWMFRRGRLLRDLIEKHLGSQGVFLCDTSLRPAGWPEPSLMKLGRENGIGILAGSDALPLAGEERLIGTYGISLEGHFDSRDPFQSFCTLLRAPGSSPRVIGRRVSLGHNFLRQLRLRWVR